MARFDYLDLRSFLRSLISVARRRHFLSARTLAGARYRSTAVETAVGYPNGEGDGVAPCSGWRLTRALRRRWIFVLGKIWEKNSPRIPNLRTIDRVLG
jgi:hypothetical protein